MKTKMTGNDVGPVPSNLSVKSDLSQSKFPVKAKERVERIVVRRTASAVSVDGAIESVWDINGVVGEPYDDEDEDEDDDDDDNDENANDVQHSNTADTLSTQPTRSLSTPTHTGLLHLSTVLVDITTGRTHQIRKHMDMIGR